MEPKQHGLLFHVLDVVLNIVIIVAVVVAIRTFLVSPFQVDGESMESTLQDGEYIIINKLAYHIGIPQRGDVAVLRPPTNDKKHYVKRIIGIPGDTVSIHDGYVHIRNANTQDEVRLDESYLNDKNLGHTFKHPQMEQSDERMEYVVPEGQYFVLGDNRKNSTDSRSFVARGSESAFVPEDNIQGRVWFIALPITKIHALEVPNYGV